jgi:hypothetical protein
VNKCARVGVEKSVSGAHTSAPPSYWDLFLTKWSSIPGELELILARRVEFGGDHLTQTGVVLSRG